MELVIPVNPLASAPPAGSSHQPAARGEHGRAFQSDLEAAAQRDAPYETPTPPKTSVGRVESGDAADDSSEAPTEEVLDGEATSDVALYWWEGLAVTDHVAPAEPPLDGEGAMASHLSEVGCADCAGPVLVAAAVAAGGEQPVPAVASAGQGPTGDVSPPSEKKPLSDARALALPPGEPGAPGSALPPVSASRSYDAPHPVGGDAPIDEATAIPTPSDQTHEPVADGAEPIMPRAQAALAQQEAVGAGSSENGQNEDVMTPLSEVATTGIGREGLADGESADPGSASEEQASQAFEFNGRADHEVGGSPPSTTPPRFVSEVRQAARGPLAEASGAPMALGSTEVPVPSSASVRLDVPQIEGEPVRLHVSLVQQTVYARVVTSQVDVQDYLVRHQDRLAANLQSHGLEMGQLQVDLGAPGQQHMSQSWTHQSSPLPTDRLNEAPPAPEGLEVGRLTERRSRLDVVA